MSGKRRGRRGQGSIYRRPDGNWQGQLDLGFVDGRRKRLTFSAPSQEAVVAKIQSAGHSLRRGTPVPAERQTFAQFVTKWQAAAENSVRERTFRGYCELLAHAVRTLGRIPLVKLTPGDLMRLYDERKKAGAKPLTILHLHRAVHRCLRDAERWGDATRNVARLVDPPKAPRPEMRALDTAEARRLLDAVKGDRLEALLVLALATGARQGELLALSWRDVDFDDGAIAIRGSVVPTADGLRILDTKTPRSRRRIQFGPPVVAALKRHRAAQEMERRVVGLGWEDHGLVFCDAAGDLLDGRNVTRAWFRPLLARTGLSKSIRFHDIRHTYASIALAQGVHPKIVQEALGHSTIAVTLDLYSHVVPSLQRDAARTMGAVLFG